MSDKNLKTIEANSSNTKKTKFIKILNFVKNQKCCSKLFNSFLLIILGVILTLCFQGLKRNYEISIVKKHLNDFYHDFDSDYVGLVDGEDDIAREIHKMQKRINQAFKSQQSIFENDFNNTFSSNFNNNSSNVKIHEDVKNFYYELVFSGFKKDEINVEIKDNILTFQAIKNSKEEKEKDSNKDKKLEIKNQNTTSFSYSFYLNNFNSSIPADITRLDDKVIVKIAKK